MKPIQLLPLLLALLLSLHSLPSAIHSDLASERVALITLRNAVEGRSLLWNLSSSPCSWVSVFCDSTRTTVVELRFPGMGLSGHLPNSIGNLPSLQTLSLCFNALTGTIPSNIGNITSLCNLYKATLESGLAVAVKRLKDVTITEKEFREKIQWVGNMDHENLVALRAYYYNRDEKLRHSNA